MKERKYIVVTIILWVLIFIMLIARGNIGVSKGKLESDARKSHDINQSWLTAKSINENFGAFLFYDEDLKKYTFSIYENREGFSFGYFYCYGGGVAGIGDSIARFNSDGKGSILLSLNKVKISKLELTNGSENIKEINVNEEKPFVIIIPENIIDIRIYNVDGEVIPMNEIPTIN